MPQVSQASFSFDAPPAPQPPKPPAAQPFSIHPSLLTSGRLDGRYLAQGCVFYCPADAAQTDWGTSLKRLHHVLQVCAVTRTGSSLEIEADLIPCSDGKLGQRRRITLTEAELAEILAGERPPPG